MKVLDLTHKIDEEINVYPGTPKPTLLVAHSVERDHFSETKLILYSHHGTHIDAPKHVLNQGKSLDQFPVSVFIGSAAVLKVGSFEELSKLSMEEVLIRTPHLPQADFLLVATDWARLWGTPEYDQRSPAVPRELVQWLVFHGKKGIGIDAHSIDAMGHLENHRIALTGSMIILENLSQLSKLPDRLFRLIALPLHFRDADGSPARIIATWEEQA